MVFHDLSSDVMTKKNAAVTTELPISALQDRILATFIDVLLFFPIFSLFLNQISKKIEMRFYTAPHSLELVVLILIAVVAASGLTILTQALCLWRWQATPGMYFAKLRLVSIVPEKKRAPTLSQSLFRSVLWTIQMYFLGIPFLEVIGQAQRRGFHDRLSETMVVTLKETGDAPPNALEAQFVRQLLFGFGGILGLWITVICLHTYHSAVRGEFHKAELEQNDNLCPSITETAKNSKERVDLTIARFLSGEVDEECLQNEADFALWTDDALAQSWGYLAKSFYYHFDSEKSDTYMQKVCATDAKGEACQVANIMQNPKQAAYGEAGSWTSKFLQIRELTGHGKFEAALKKVQNLVHEHPGFEHYAQKQTVKLLWAQNNREQAIGAYNNVWPYLEDADQVDLNSWMCLEQIDQGCNNKSYSGCDNLRETLQKKQMHGLTNDAVISLVMENECKQTHDPVLLGLSDVLGENPHLKELTYALSSDTDWSTERRLAALRDLGMGRHVAANKVVQRRALLELIKRTDNVDDLKKAESTLLAMSRRDAAWEKLAVALADKAQARGQTAIAKAMHDPAPQLKAAPSSGKDTERLPASAAQEEK